jgi:CheY-like chemotaxis protein
MPAGGVLTISAKDTCLDESYAAQHPAVRPGPGVMLTVCDTGIGIDDNTLEHIFEPFFTTKDPGKGTGLGLSTVHGIVKQHGGIINVRSEKNQGTTFEVFIPQADDAALGRARVISVRDPMARGVETILVAEDNELVRALSCNMLESLGYSVLSTDNVNECLRLAQDHRGSINLLLTDVIMPGMNGKELFEILSRVRPRLKVLFMSGYTSDVIGQHGVLGAGMNYIQKPFSLHALSEKVRQALDS